MSYMEAAKKRLEAEIGDRLTRFNKEYMGRGPLETRVYILDDMLIVRMKDVLTPAERKLSERKDCIRCPDVIKQFRRLLFEQGRDQLDEIVYEVLGAKVVSLYDDVSVETGESVLLFTLDKKVTFE